MPEETIETGEYTPAFSSIRTSVPPVLRKAPIEVEPTALYRQKKDPVYAGKFTERFPKIPGAGYLVGQEGPKVVELMKGPKEIPRPDNVDKFHNYYATPYEQRRIHYGQVNDPERQIAINRVHGLPSNKLDSAADSLNPPPKSLVEHELDRMHEDSVFLSHKKPIGSVPKSDFLAGFDLKNTTFGIKTVREDHAGDLVNPKKSYLQVEWENDKCRDLYRLSHSAYYSGEQKHRDYPCYDPKKTYGKPTPNDPLGKKTKKALDWLSDCLDRKGARIESERLINYRERFSHKIGQVRDPIADTMSVDPLCYPFGLDSKPDPYNAGDLIHQRTPKEWLYNHWNRRNAIISEVRRQLRKMLWADFEQMINICLEKDKQGTGSVSLDEMRSIFKTMGVPLEPEVLEQLLDFCDVGAISSETSQGELAGPILGRIDYKELICILNWTDKNVGDAKTEACSKFNAEDAANVKNLEQKIDRSVTDYSKTSSTYGANADVSTRLLRTFGVPSRRSDLPAPALRKLDDRQNYGDEPSAGAIIRPSIMARHGISEQDFFMPRNKTEMKSILSHIGVDMSESDFDTIWQKAREVDTQNRRTVKQISNPNEFQREAVSFESFRVVLDEILARQGSNGQLVV